MTIMGYSRCTEREGFADESVEHHLKKNVTYGPDGTEWVLLTDDEVQDFCSNRGRNLEHRGKTFFDHICAGQGSWGFDARDSTYVCCVVFLHYNIKAKLNKTLGGVDDTSGAKIFHVKGTDLFGKYQSLSSKLASENKAVHGRAVHVWERKTHGEIAIDFCIK